MAKITAADVAKLRKMTGAGMMDCKKALVEADGDFEKAVEILRKKGRAISAKRADREAKEGVVLAKAQGDKGVMIALNCETDFVARTDDFIAVANKILDLAFDKFPASLDELKSLTFEDGKTVQDEVVNTSAITGEKVELGYYDKIEGQSVGKYIHFDKKTAVLVAFNKADVAEEVMANIAMQIAAMMPIAVDKDDVPEAVVNKEMEIIKEALLNEGKPADKIDMIAKGKLNKFFKEKTLLNQIYVRDGKITVRDYLKSIDKDLTVIGFVRYSLKN